MIKIFHTQNPRPNFNFGLDYRLISAPGFFVTQNANNSNYRIFSNYQGKRKRYSAFFTLFNNSFKNLHQILFPPTPYPSVLFSMWFLFSKKTFLLFFFFSTVSKQFFIFKLITPSSVSLPLFCRSRSCIAIGVHSARFPPSWLHYSPRCTDSR